MRVPKIFLPKVTQDVKSDAVQVVNTPVITYDGFYQSKTTAHIPEVPDISSRYPEEFSLISANFADVKVSFPSKDDGEWYPTDEVPVGATCVYPDGEC